MNAFFRRRQEESSSERGDRESEKPNRKLFQRKEEAPEMPIEKAVPADLRLQSAHNADTGLPPKTFFATESEFKQPEVPSVADSVLQVALESVDIHELPINWDRVAELGKAIWNISGTFTDLTALKPPASAQEFVPMLASVVAHRNNPAIPIELPTQQQIKAAKPWVETLQRFLSRFSERAARGLGNYAEREGERIIEDLGQKITGFADFVGTVENPKAELLKELALMYTYVKENSGTSIEENVERFLRDLQWAQKHPEAYDDTSRFLNNRDFPVLLKGLSKLNVPLASLDAHTISIAGAELMQGVEMFLRQQGVGGVRPAPQPREFDLFDPSTWERGIGEALISLGLMEDRFKQVREHLPAMLSSAYEALPTNGKELKDKIYKIAENICALHKNGHSAVEIVRSMFPGMARIEMQTNAYSAPKKIIEDEISAGSFVGLVVGGVAVFYFGASIIYIPIAVIGGMAAGAVTGTVGLFSFLRKQAGRNP